MKKLIFAGVIFTLLMSLPFFGSEKSKLQSIISILKIGNLWYQDPLRTRLDNDHYSNEEITILCPSIKILENIPDGQRWGVCHNYAISKKLGLTGKIPETFSMRGADDWYTQFNFLNDYCQKVISPQKGDLVIYKNWFSKILHTGLIYDPDNELVESKWGTRKCVFVHPKRHVPSVYGDYIEYYRPIKLNVEIIEDIQQKIMIADKSEYISENKWLLSVAANPKSTITLRDIKEILDRNMWVDPNTTTDNGQTPLILTTKHTNHFNMIKIAQLLIIYKADINHQDKDGNTALITAAKYDNMPMMELLRQQPNCNKKLRDNTGNKASYYEYKKHPPAPYALRRMAKPTKSAQSDFWHTMNS